MLFFFFMQGNNSNIHAFNTSYKLIYKVNFTVNKKSECC